MTGAMPLFRHGCAEGRSAWSALAALKLAKLGCRTRVAVDAGYMRADGNYPFTLVNGKYVTEEKRNNSASIPWQGEATFYHTFKRMTANWM